MSESENCEKCQRIFRNLLAAKRASSCVYIRELGFTDQCDDFYDFSRIRRSYAELVGESAMDRIRMYDETKEDERRAKQAVTHYSIGTTQHLVAALTWPNWLWYQFG
jgi:hypothetical protein